ncbi:MAG: ABC transporter ATP-binding protein [Rhodoglobus sp.]
MSAVRATATRLATAFGLAWRASPVLLVAYVLVNVVTGVAPVATVWLAKVAIDRLSAGAEPGELVAVAIALAAVGLAVAALSPVTQYVQAELGRLIAVHSKEKLYGAVTGIALLGTLEVPSFRDRLRLAEQSSRSGPGQVVDSAVGLVESTLTLMGMVGAIAVLSPGVAAVLVVAAVPALFAELKLNRSRALMEWTISPVERREFFYGELMMSLSAAKEMRLFGLGPLFKKRMLRELSVSNAEQRRFDQREGATQIILSAFSAILAGAALVWTLLAAARGEMTIGDVTAVIFAVGSVQSALMSTVNQVAAIHGAGLLIDHYLAIIATPQTTVTPALTAMPASEALSVVFDDVWFRYGDDLPWVLRGVSLTLAEGEALAVVGENGAGKSTLIKLLCRFYDPSRGSIRWNGVDLRELPLAELHRRIGAVFQDFMTYDLNAEENIALGDVDGRDELDLSPDRIHEAARRAQIHEKIESFPLGYRTMLSREFFDPDEEDADGVVLSGGQWQRLALARALLRGQRDLLILDEPSSGLDAEAESSIHQAIRQYRRGRTSVLVSHRLNAVRDADRILVLGSGQVIECDSHDALMAAGGTYARLFRLQASGYETTTAP